MADQRHAGEVKRFGHGEDSTPLRLIAVVRVRRAFGESERRHVDRDDVEAPGDQGVHGPAPNLTPGAGSMNEEHRRPGRWPVLLDEHVDVTGAHEMTAEWAGQ